MAARFGCQIPLRVSVRFVGKNFSSQILRAKAAIVDALVFLGTVLQAVGQVRQMKENRCNETTEARPFHIQ
jgi:ABC-type branched-subunit amino acid transport system substrate-binding protein